MQAARSLGGRIRGVLLDLSGTLYIDTAPTLGAVEALNRCAGSSSNAETVTPTFLQVERGGRPDSLRDKHNEGIEDRSLLAAEGHRIRRLAAPDLHLSHCSAGAHRSRGSDSASYAGRLGHGGFRRRQVQQY